ncbi:MAG: hypothetical protein V3T67_00835 [Nitrosopumilaceae archaeon]
MRNLIEKFNSVNSLQISLEKEIEDTELIIKEYSNLLGEKIRTNIDSSTDDPEFLELKAKLDGGSDDKSKDKKSKDKKSKDKKSKDKKSKDKKPEIKKSSDKKKKSKKGVSDKWYDLNEILVYNGIGLKGELELYFKAIDESKSKLENLHRTLASLNNVIEKGLKGDMGCVVFRGTEGILQIAFLKSTGVRENFSLKSIYTGTAIPVENMIKIGV